jgi:hypothetical protein
MLTLALLIEGEAHIEAECDGITGTLPSFGLYYAPIAVQCAAALKEADPGAAVSLELRDVAYDWTAIEALGQAAEALALVMRVATWWRLRLATAAMA